MWGQFLLRPSQGQFWQLFFEIAYSKLIPHLILSNINRNNCLAHIWNFRIRVFMNEPMEIFNNLHPLIHLYWLFLLLNILRFLFSLLVLYLLQPTFFRLYSTYKLGGCRSFQLFQLFVQSKKNTNHTVIILKNKENFKNSMYKT